MPKAPKCPTCGRRINGAQMFIHLQCAQGGQAAYKLHQEWVNERATESAKALDTGFNHTETNP